MEINQNKQEQNAGDNAQQFQANNIIFNNGITEKRAREIYIEMSRKAIEECTNEANATADKRIREFENHLIPRMEAMESNFESFTDPSFQVLLKKAQLTACCTDREADYKILSELLVHRVKNKKDIKRKASITKAAEIIDQIDDDALCALTVFHAINTFIPTAGDIILGLRILDELYEKLNLEELPNDTLWMDNLSILGAIDIIPFEPSKKYEEYLFNSLDGYICTGIKKYSEEHRDIINDLMKVQISPTVLVDNILLEGYVRISLYKKDAISKALNNQQKECLNKILDMYVKDDKLQIEVKQNFNKLFYSFKSIKKAFDWKNSIKQSVRLTSIGRVIAHANARRINNSLPDLD